MRDGRVLARQAVERRVEEEGPGGGVQLGASVKDQLVGRQAQSVTAVAM